jgi:cellulose synthase/poly-beta-1,6-N-acetylglucosamine synthase-like glycosyltransferase
MEIVFGLSLVILVYTYLGYPLMLWILGRLFSRQVRHRACEPRVVLIVVVYNEAARISRKLDSCLALDYPRDKLRIIVASDGSDDKTNDTVAAFADNRVTLLAFPERRGKAACVNDAVAASEEEIVVLTDARQRIDANAIRYLVGNFADPAIGAVSGDLVFETDGMTEFGGSVDAYWRYEKFIRQQESRWHSVVGATGALYALRRECFRKIPPDTILDDVVIPMNVVMAGRRVVFESRAKAYDFPSRDHRQEMLRKVRTLAGNFQLITDQPRFFVPLRNPLFLQLVSHKVLRLLGPLCMVALLLSNLLLVRQAALYQFFLAAQVFAYTLAVGGTVWSRASRWKAAKIASTFLLLNWFVVLGLAEFLRNRNAHLWKSKKMASSKKA